MFNGQILPEMLPTLRQLLLNAQFNYSAQIKLHMNNLAKLSTTDQSYILEGVRNAVQAIVDYSGQNIQIPLFTSGLSNQGD